MNTALLRIFVIFSLAFGIGLWAGCTTEDFDTADPGKFYCEEDEDCPDNYECDPVVERCVAEEDENGNGNGNGGPDECIPDDHDDYPLDEPLELQEVCDGQDNNCDGYVDVIFCESDDDCPSSGEDLYGTSLNYSCEEVDELPVERVDGEDENGNGEDDNGNGEDEESYSICQAYHSDTFACPDPFPCDSEAGAHESVYEACGEGEEPTNGDEPDECDPDELGDDYPLDEPLDVQELCDGQDNTCDGQVDVIFCEDNSDCPDSGEDVYGTSLEYECEDNGDDESVCNAYYTDRDTCPDPMSCDSGEGAHESVFEACGEGEEPPEDD